MIRFADFDLDPAALRICRDGWCSTHSPQTVEVLAFLIENRERTVAGPNCSIGFWPRAGTGGDAALNTCIRRIRSLLVTKLTLRALFRPAKVRLIASSVRLTQRSRGRT